MTKNDIKLSSEFKTQTTKAIVSIVLFVLTYMLILLMAAVLTALCVYGGVMLIIKFPKFITIGLGIGLAGFGIIILTFLIKFIFKSHKVDRSHLYEINKAEEPEFFDLIDEIVNEVGTTFPKKVYLSTDVDAAVFYDSSFLSMFFPINKNLQIGLGLVNAITKAELKAILSHEFGHFSQKTMKLGSYVHHLNQVIFNMLFDNESYDKLVKGWASIIIYFAFFTSIAVKIIAGIKWILIRLYDVMNKNYLGLSREMEFHADEIAASITGFIPLKSSLLRTSLADHSFDSVLTFYDGKVDDNLKSENIYREQSYVLNFLAEDNNIPILNNLPEVTEEDLNNLNKFNESKLVIKDQWASHPSDKERIERMEKTNIVSEKTEHTSANEVFNNIQETQKKLTNKIFEEVQFSNEAISIPLEKFQLEYKKELLYNTFSKFYNGYYDAKNTVHFEINTTHTPEDNIEIEELFSDQKVDLVYTTISLQNDIETLKQIADKTISVKSFDYNGKNYKRKESKKLLSELNFELEKANEQIKRNDIRIFKFFRKCEQTQDSISQLEKLYWNLFEFDNQFDVKYSIYVKLTNKLQFVNITTPIEKISANFQKIEPIEVQLKNCIKEMMKDINYETEITKAIKDNFELYLTKQWKYFSDEEYFDDNLEILYAAMNNYATLLMKGYFLRKKRILIYQEDLIEKPSLPGSD